MPHSRKTRLTVWAAAAALTVAVGCQLIVNLDGLDDGRCGQNEKACPGGYCVPKDDPNTGCSENGCAPCALPHAQATCGQNGHCVIVGCVVPWQDCDKIPETGCEIDVSHDPRHCGECMADPCPKPPNGSAGCSAGRCAIGECNPGYEDCDHAVDGGCERKIWTDDECLTCGVPCATGTHCMQGVCMAGASP
jgi:hypothetical protein